MRSINELIKILGGIQVPAGAGLGRVLTSDALGTGTWGPPMLPATAPTVSGGSMTISPNQRLIVRAGGLGPALLASAPPAGTVCAVAAIAASQVINVQGSDTIALRSGTSGLTTITVAPGTDITLQYVSGVWWVIGGAAPIVPSPWVAPALLNAWAVYTAAEPVGYLKDAQGLVWLRGRVKGGANGSVVFNLPAGYRPGNDSDTYPVAGFNGATPIAAGLTIGEATGAVNAYFTAGATDLGLSGVRFLAEN